MDIISHGLWGSLAFGRKNRGSFRLAFLYGVGPDLFAFGVYFATSLFGLTRHWRFFHEPPDPASIPAYVYRLYSVSHSLIAFAFIFVALWFLFRRPIWEFSAWGLHILFDIPTHSYRFFPTPFLWPLSGFTFSGWSWASPWILFPDILLLTVLYAWFFLFRRVKSSKRLRV